MVRHEAVQIFRKQVADWLDAEAGREGNAELVWKMGREVLVEAANRWFGRDKTVRQRWIGDMTVKLAK